MQQTHTNHDAARDAGHKPTPRIKLGRDQVNGFFGLSDGDCFEAEDGALYLLKPYNGGWGLRPMNDEGKADFLAPVHPAFQGVDHSGFIYAVNIIYGANH